MIALKLFCLITLLSEVLSAPCSNPSWVAQSLEAAAFFQDPRPSGILSGAPFTSLPPLPMHVCWHLASNGTRIVFSVAAQQNQSMGWVAVGISSGGGMNGADIAALIWDEKNQSYALRDYFAPATNVLIEDQVNNLQLHRVITSGNLVAFNFSRPVVPCDVVGDIAIPPQTVSLIGAIGTTQRMSYHGRNRGSVSVSLLASNFVQKAPIANPNEVVREFKITTSVVMPSKETTYICQPVELPSDRKYHAIEFNPVGINEYVHHMIFFLCPDQPNETQVHECPLDGMKCQSFMAGWAVGMGSSYFPANGGYPFGEESAGSRWGVLQVHLHNPNTVSGVSIRQAGFSMQYTPNVRPVDHGVFTLGFRPDKNFFLPPGQKFTSHLSVCPSECTSMWTSPITVTGIAFHMHELGRSIWLEHRRPDGTPLPPVGVLPYYDFSMGGSIDVPNVVIQPGDNLVLHCAYDTSSKNTTIYGGEATSQEMCLAFIRYYPKSQTMDLSIDLSLNPQVASFFGTATICGSSLMVREAESSQTRVISMLKKYPPELRSRPIVPPLNGAACTNLTVGASIDSVSGTASLLVKPSLIVFHLILISILYLLIA